MRCAICKAVLEDGQDNPTRSSLHPMGAALADLTRTQLQAVAANRPTDAAVLVVARGANLGARFELHGDVTRLGRDATAEIFLDDITVSRRHAELRRADADYIAVDLGSLNGTYLNGVRVTQCGVHNGDQLQIGKFKLLFFAPEGVQP
jgi:pSer/pThr/pTyr-binding forkhead associated (FHA) protein